MNLKVTCRISRKIGKDYYLAPPPPKAGEIAQRGVTYTIDAERAGKYADYFNFASSEDEGIARQAFAARKAADDAAWLASRAPAFSLTDLAQAVAKLLQPQAESAARKVQAT